MLLNELIPLNLVFLQQHIKLILLNGGERLFDRFLEPNALVLAGVVLARCSPFRLDFVRIDHPRNRINDEEPALFFDGIVARREVGATREKRRRQRHVL